MALAGKRVILIDGDLREPRLSERFGYEGETGLTDVLRGRSRLESEVRLWQADLNLGILPAGGTVDNPSELLSSQALVSVLDTCRRSADVVLIDTPPLLNVTDGSVVAGLADAALLVVRNGEDSLQSAAAAAAQLREANTELHGVIIDNVPGVLASRFRFRERRAVEISEIPAVLTPAVGELRMSRRWTSRRGPRSRDSERACQERCCERRCCERRCCQEQRCQWHRRQRQRGERCGHAWPPCDQWRCERHVPGHAGRGRHPRQRQWHGFAHRDRCGLRDADCAGRAVERSWGERLVPGRLCRSSAVTDPYTVSR